MPIYEFECPRCNHRFEELLRSSRAKTPPCPECGCKRPERLMSGFAMGGRSADACACGEPSSGCSSCSSSSCSGCHH